MCVTSSDGEILGDDSSHWDGCVPIDELPDPADLPDDVRYSIVDGDHDDAQATQ